MLFLSLSQLPLPRSYRCARFERSYLLVKVYAAKFLSETLNTFFSRRQESNKQEKKKKKVEEEEEVPKLFSFLFLLAFDYE